MKREQAHFFERRGTTLYTVEYVPAVRPDRACILLNPLDNEANYSTHFYVRVARRLAQAGTAVLRFDYRGTGNSMGEFQEVSLAALYDDIQIMCEHALNMFGDLSLYLIGGRFGANLASAFAAQWPEVDSLILWDPILRPEREFRTNFVNKTLLNNKLMGGLPQSVRAIEKTVEEQGCVELNGALFSGEFYRQMASWQFAADGVERASSVGVFLSSTVAASERDILQSLEQRGAKVELFENAGHRNAWGGEQFSTSEEAEFLADATLALAQTLAPTEIGTECERT